MFTIFGTSCLGCNVLCKAVSTCDLYRSPKSCCTLPTLHTTVAASSTAIACLEEEVVHTWQELEQLGPNLEEGEVAHHAILFPLAAEQAQQLLHCWRGPFGLAPRGTHLSPMYRFSLTRTLSMWGSVNHQQLVEVRGTTLSTRRLRAWCSSSSESRLLEPLWQQQMGGWELGTST